MRRFTIIISAVLVAVAACSDGITAPNCERCDEMQVITDRPEYRPGSTIAFTISNRTTQLLRYDWCSVGLASRGNGDDFPPATYSPARRCGIGADIDEVLEHLVLIRPGESLRDSVTISGAANQSWYRVMIWLLDENGVPQPGNPVVSNTFDVYPGANSSVTR
jgi:hypothetical protein